MRITFVPPTLAPESSLFSVSFWVSPGAPSGNNLIVFCAFAIFIANKPANNKTNFFMTLLFKGLVLSDFYFTVVQALDNRQAFNMDAFLP